MRGRPWGGAPGHRPLSAQSPGVSAEGRRPRLLGFCSGAPHGGRGACRPQTGSPFAVGPGRPPWGRRGRRSRSPRKAALTPRGLWGTVGTPDVPRWHLLPGRAAVPPRLGAAAQCPSPLPCPCPRWGWGHRRATSWCVCCWCQAWPAHPTHPCSCSHRPVPWMVLTQLSALACLGSGFCFRSLP